MSSRIASMPTIRAAQNFTATAVKHSTRRLHITGAKENPSTYLKPAVVAAQPSSKTETSRAFNTSRTLKHPNDNSTIDFAFLPAADSAAFAPGTVSTAALNIPILPDNYRASTYEFAQPMPIVDIPAEIETVSMSHPGQVAVMSETDIGATHEGRDSDVFKMVESVSRNVRNVKESAEKEAGVMRELLGGMLGDILGGSKRTA